MITTFRFCLVERVVIKSMQVDQESKKRPTSNRGPNNSSHPLFKEAQIATRTPNEIINQSSEYEEPTYTQSSAFAINEPPSPKVAGQMGPNKTETVPFKEFVQYAQSRKALYKLMAFKSKYRYQPDFFCSEAISAAIPPVHY